MKNFGIILLTLLLSACQSGSNEASFQDYKAESTGYSEYEEEQQTNTNLQVPERKIIKTVDIRFQVDDLIASTKRIEAITEQFSGFISSMNQSNSSYSINNTLTIRLPSEKLDEFILAIEKESVYTNYKRINARDVTEEYVDISGRLATKKEVRDRYIEILRNKAKTVQDILEAEEKIRVIQEEIESIEGRLKYLNNQTSLSTVNIELYQEVEYIKPPRSYKKSFFTKIKEGFADGWELIQGLAIGVVTIWPIILILLILYLIRKKLRNVFRRKKPDA